MVHNGVVTRILADYKTYIIIAPLPSPQKLAMGMGGQNCAKAGFLHQTLCMLVLLIVKTTISIVTPPCPNTICCSTGQCKSSNSGSTKSDFNTRNVNKRSRLSIDVNYGVPIVRRESQWARNTTDITLKVCSRVMS